MVPTGDLINRLCVGAGAGPDVTCVDGVSAQAVGPYGWPVTGGEADLRGGHKQGSDPFFTTQSV